MKIKKTTFTLFLLLFLFLTSCVDNGECKHESTTWVVDKESTCGVPGFRHEECTICNTILNEEIITSMGHEMYEGECIICHKTSSEGLEYKLNDDSYSVIGIGTCTDSDIIIPSEYNGIEVDEIEEGAFAFSHNITSIYIPKTISEIQDLAIVGCINLTSIVVDHENFRYDSRNNCNAIIDSTNNTLLVGCTTTIIPSSVTSIGSYAFSRCSSLSSITFDENSQLTSIGDYAFYECSILTSIEIPESVTSIGSSSFFSCNRLTSITFGENSQLTSIGEDAFYGCSSLTSIEIPDSVTTIGEDAFCDCSNLRKVIFEEGSQLTSIGDYAFSECYSLTSIEIPNSVTSIGGYAFKNCSNLRRVIFEEGSQLISIGWNAFENCGNLTSIELPNSVTSIESDAFKNCSNLTSITFDENSQLTSIGQDAFLGCDNLYKVYYDDTLESWCNITFDSEYSNPMSQALRFCMKNENDEYYELRTIQIPDTVTNIGRYQFYGFSRILELYIPNSVKEIDIMAFSKCEFLEKIEVEKNGYFNSRDNSNAIISYGTIIVGCKTTKIPESVTSISSYAFYGCSGLLQIEIPDNIKFIGEEAFSNCENLEKIYLPSSVSAISDYAFLECKKLTIYTEHSDKPEQYSSHWNVCTIELNDYNKEEPTSYCEVKWNQNKEN